MRTYFAQLNNENKVIDIHVVTQEFIQENPDRYPGVWVETFYDSPNKQYAGLNFTYDFNTQDFTPPIVISIPDL